jgi:hypothetical protein
MQPLLRKARPWPRRLSARRVACVDLVLLMADKVRCAVPGVHADFQAQSHLLMPYYQQPISGPSACTL